MQSKYCFSLKLIPGYACVLKEYHRERMMVEERWKLTKCKLLEGQSRWVLYKTKLHKKQNDSLKRENQGKLIIANNA